MRSVAVARRARWRGPAAGALAAVAAAVAIGALRAPLAERLVASGLAAQRQWRLAAAARRFDAALLADRHNPRARLAAVVCAELRGEFRAANRDLERFPPESFADLRLRAAAWNAAGVAHYHANRPDRAVASHRRALELAERLADPTLEAAARIGAARVLYYSLGRSVDAWRELERALALARAAGDRRLEADALRHQGSIAMWQRGEGERAVAEFYRPALALYEAVDDRHGAAITLNNLALTHGRLGDLGRGLVFADRSFALKRAIGDRAGLADSFWVAANLHLQGGNPRRAWHLLEEGRLLAHDAGYRLAEIEIDNSLSEVLLELGELDAAIALAEERPEVLAELAPYHAKYRLSRLGALYLLRGDAQRAGQLFAGSLALDRSSGRPEQEGGCLLQIARAQLLAGDLGAAARTFDRGWALLARDVTQAWDGRRHALETRAEIRQAQGRVAEALAALLEAAEIERAALGGGDAPMLAGEDRRLYDRLLPLLVDPAAGAGVEAAFQVVEGLRRRASRDLGRPVARVDPPTTAGDAALAARIAELSEEFGRRPTPERWDELRRAYGDYEDRVLLGNLPAAHGPTTAARSPDLAAVQGALSPSTALLYLEPAPAAVLALVVRRDRAQAVALDVDRRTLSVKVGLLADLLHRDDAGGWRPVAEDLRRRLIEPLEGSGLLAGVRRLGILPSGFLHDLPFAALTRPDAGGPRFLADDYALFFPPSGGFLAEAARGDRPHGGTIHAFACDRCAAGRPALAHAEAEAAAVARLLGGEAHLGPAATEAALTRVAPTARVLHLAAHAAAPAELPLLAHLELAPEGDDDGRLTVPEILALDLRAELVALGACRSGRGRSAGGGPFRDADRIGLLEAWLAAGARSVVASLEPVDDRASRLLLEAFYRRLAAGAGEAEALAAAQRDLRRGGFDHPRFWAPYLLAGDPG